MNDLIVDPQIRVWVFLPIIIITFTLTIIKHYVTYLISSPKQVEMEQIADGAMILRGQLLRNNGHYIPKEGFTMRKHHFTNEKFGWLLSPRSNVTPNLFTDPTKVTDMMKNNVVNILPMFAIGGWIVWMFSGFLIARVPFPLTIRFKSMLQSDIHLVSLDASWVSSVSWYFLNVCGLKSIHELVLNENFEEGASYDQEIANFVMSLPQDTQNLFKRELEAFKMTEHDWILKDVFK
ncbi:Integral membrane protein EMC3/TMCO1-like [Popillia japonica]|uniref:ER membrane protein complex subunit 3 n=1 Tax=Popillia japonica TaxID=7064 RepID=A0AAW1HVU9_POPJA